MSDRVVRWRPLAEEAKAEGQLSEAMKQALAGEDTAANAGLYLLLRSVDRFHATYNRFPGSFDRCASPHGHRNILNPEQVLVPACCLPCYSIIKACGHSIVCPRIQA